MAVTVQPGSLPFRVLDLIGRERADLPGTWEPVPTSRERGGALERLRYTARGWVEGRQVEIHVYTRLCGGRVWAVAVEAPGLIFRVEQTAADPLLVAVDYPPLPPGLVNWISVRDGQYYDVGLAG